ncbi:MAG: WbqC family protein [Muribaculaceae bacterium]|nr:WbqC family protein [Muribaculaceae bacterium]
MNLIRFPEGAVVVSPAYLGSTDYWAAVCAFGRVTIDDAGRFDKRLKSTHRCEIADVNGMMQLTVPIEKPVSMTAARWNQIRLSAHGEWWHQHRVAMESAYGGTPYFEYYAPLFEPFWQPEALTTHEHLTDYDRALFDVIARIAGVEGTVERSSQSGLPAEAADYRGKRLPQAAEVPYYQVRGARLGFIAHLSIVDLIFNMGPETPLVLKRMIEETKSPFSSLC